MNQRSVRPRVWPWVIKAVVLAAAYFVVARVGLRYAAIGESISPVWPPTGLALAALLVLGPRYWPAVFFGALLANAATAVPLTAATGIAAGNTAEAVLGAYLMCRLAGEHGVASITWSPSGRSCSSQDRSVPWRAPASASARCG